MKSNDAPKDREAEEVDSVERFLAQPAFHADEDSPRNDETIQQTEGPPKRFGKSLIRFLFEKPVGQYSSISQGPPTDDGRRSSHLMAAAKADSTGLQASLKKLRLVVPEMGVTASVWRIGTAIWSLVSLNPELKVSSASNIQLVFLDRARGSWCAVLRFVESCNAGSGADSTSGEIHWGRGSRLGGRTWQ